MSWSVLPFLSTTAATSCLRMRLAVRIQCLRSSFEEEVTAMTAVVMAAAEEEEGERERERERER